MCLFDCRFQLMSSDVVHYILSEGGERIDSSYSMLEGTNNVHVVYVYEKFCILLKRMIHPERDVD